MQPIFSESFLSAHIANFRLADVVKIYEKKEILKSWINDLESGKLSNEKEEEVKSRFITELFGQVLDYNYKNSNSWLLREEVKTKIDSTKPDGALGYFSIQSNSISNDVRAIIEIKDAKTDLDKNQNRKNYKITPVEQAFSYASKMGGSCKWVIVSNLLEIRFYHANDQSKYQVFFLKELLQEAKLKELLFLFHKDRFINGQKSQTEVLFESSKKEINKLPQQKHVLDEIYFSLKRFEGLSFIDPNFIANLHPFNISNDYVWHYEQFNLLTLNKDVHNLFQGIEIVDSKIIISNELREEFINREVTEYEFKLEYIFKRLNRSLITSISAVNNSEDIKARNKSAIGFSLLHKFHISDTDGFTKSILLTNSETCDCIKCNYRNFDFRKILTKLKISEGKDEENTFENAYANYLVAANDFKKPYNIYKNIERESKGKEDKAIEYFLAKYNLKYLHNLVLHYPFEDGKAILKNIRNIDLDKVVYNEIELSVDEDVKKYLLEIKEDVLIYKIQDEVNEIVEKIRNLKQLYMNGGKLFAGSNKLNELHHQYILLFAHINSNFIIYDIFTKYKAITTTVFQGLIDSYLTPGFGLKRFNEFYLTEAILHITPDKLQAILKNVSDTEIEKDCIIKLIEKVSNFLKSYYKDGVFNDPFKDDLLQEYLLNFRFKEKFTDIFSNIFTIFSRIEIDREEFQTLTFPLIKFLKIEEELAWNDIREFSHFIKKKGRLFNESQLVELLNISISRDKYGFNKYRGLIKQLTISIGEFYPDFKIQDKYLIRKAIANCYSDSNRVEFKHIIHLCKIVNESEKKLLLDTFEEHFEEKFDPDLYDSLIRNKILDYKYKDYFEKYINHINKTKGKGFIGFSNGNPEFENLTGFNFLLLLYVIDIDFNDQHLTSLTNFSDFESWLLNPFLFDYSKFEAKWLLAASNEYIFNKINSIKEISVAVKEELKVNFNPELSRIYFKHFAN